MKYYAGVTDNSWFNYLSQTSPEDVNFWQPSGNVRFKAIPFGSPFLFKLKKPNNNIAGIGYYVKHTFLPITMAWDVFGERNGCVSFFDFKNLILKYRKDGLANPQIGCIVLTDPIFFKKEDWIEAPSDWANSIVQGKTYDTSDNRVGKEVWEKVKEVIERYRAPENNLLSSSVSTVEDPISRYGVSFTKYRIGQGAFRVLVTEAYSRKCTISGEKTLPVLEAAHIKSYKSNGPHQTSNGLLLRSDIHKLFDSGYITVTPDYSVEVSSRIKKEFENGKEYYKFHGQKLIYLPPSVDERPSTDYLDWHNINIYKS
ncbi:HNH endonuclease [Spirosoma foliorum]|uniref:HNH endonuclease n=1 Tax=Spirosoma foliorum TaxID=2710596 RepID=A0A7G5GPV6_9BACT|nr:HNH endonuclease [Spirosoma foliorum]QMW00898.1 HNH endonuclease [Spirosoma foliorum]